MCKLHPPPFSRSAVGNTFVNRRCQPRFNHIDVPVVHYRPVPPVLILHRRATLAHHMPAGTGPTRTPEWFNNTQAIKDKITQFERQSEVDRELAALDAARTRGAAAPVSSEG